MRTITQVSVIVVTMLTLAGCRTAETLPIQVQPVRFDPVRLDPLRFEPIELNLPPSGPPPQFAKGTATCEKAVYTQVSTGNDKGKCEPTVKSGNRTLTYKCDDGAGNTVTVDCTENGGFGSCSSTGSGDCGGFQKL